jgi:hypothetical protein
MAWKKSALKHSQTFSCAKFEFMGMLLGGPLSPTAQNSFMLVSIAVAARA